MGVYNCQLFNNLGLCCFYAQQYDMTLTSFERALFLAANEEETADVWYNLGHVAVVWKILTILLNKCDFTETGKRISRKESLSYFEIWNLLVYWIKYSTDLIKGLFALQREEEEKKKALYIITECGLLLLKDSPFLTVFNLPLFLKICNTYQPLRVFAAIQANLT